MADAPSSAPIRILLVDDHALLRSGIRALLDLEPDLRVVGEAGNGEEGVRLAGDLLPDVIVMDLSMPGIDGIEATRRITSAHPAIRVLVVTSHPEEDHLLPVLQAGGSGYLRKTEADDDLIDAIRTVAREEVFLHPDGARLLLRQVRTGRENEAPDPLSGLSDRERQVLALTAEGFTSLEIGKKLFLSPKTVDTYRARVMQKLGLSHRSELVRLALRTGVLRPD